MYGDVEYCGSWLKASLIYHIEPLFLNAPFASACIDYGMFVCLFRYAHHMEGTGSLIEMNPGAGDLVRLS